MTADYGSGEDLALANGQSRTVIGVIIEFELKLEHNQHPPATMPLRKESLPYNFQRVRLGMYRDLEHMRMSSVGCLRQFTLTNKLFEINSRLFILKRLKFGPTALWKGFCRSSSHTLNEQMQFSLWNIR